jgi:hypothetical protein
MRWPISPGLAARALYASGIQKEADRPSEYGCCPFVQGLEAGGNFPVGLSSLRLLALWSLSQAWHLGGLHRASPVPFRGSSFTSGLHPPDATPQGLSTCLIQVLGFSIHSINALRGALGFIPHWRKQNYDAVCRTYVVQYTDGRGQAQTELERLVALD